MMGEAEKAAKKYTGTTMPAGPFVQYDYGFVFSLVAIRILPIIFMSFINVKGDLHHSYTSRFSLGTPVSSYIL